MTSIIHVDPHELRQAAHSTSEMAESLSSIADKLLYVTLGPRIYGGQLRGLTTNIGCDLRELAKKRVIRLREISALLIQLADGFEAVDQARLDGFVHIAGAMAAVAQESLVVPAIPVWLRRGACPPWMDEFFWEHEFTEEERLRILKSGEEYWAYLLRHSADMGGMDQEVLEEMLAILLLAHLGFDVNGRVAATPMLKGEYGRGKIGTWLEFNQDKKDPNVAAQYLNANELADLGKYLPLYHHNLCGQLAVMASLGLDIQEALLLFSQMDTGKMVENENGEWVWKSFEGKWILERASEGTYGHQLATFFDEAGDYDARFIKAQDNNHPEPVASSQEISQWLSEDKKLVALVNIDTIQDGKLDSVADSSNAASHWVTILDVTETFNGETLVRVYNPYYNHEEIYTWETFSEAWADTEGNTYTHYGLVVAEPKS